MARLAPIAVLALLAGCAHRLTITSDPAGAYVLLEGERVGVTPLDLTVRSGQDLRVELTGYRALDLEIRPRLGREVELRLVPEHGGAGTWDPSDAR